MSLPTNNKKKQPTQPKIEETSKRHFRSLSRRSSLLPFLIDNLKLNNNYNRLNKSQDLIVRSFYQYSLLKLACM